MIISINVSKVESLDDRNKYTKKWFLDIECCWKLVVANRQVLFLDQKWEQHLVTY